MAIPAMPQMDVRTAGATIASLRYEIQVDRAPYRVAWGSTLKIAGTLSTDTPDLLRGLADSFDMKVGLRVYDGAEKVREKRGERLSVPAGRTAVPIEIVFDTDYLRPGRHRCEIDLVIDTLRWFGKPQSFEIEVEGSDVFVDVKTFAKELGVENLAATADDYYSSSVDEEWHYRKPYSIKDIQHNWPQVSVLVRGLNLVKGMSIIDFGAGTGWISRTLSNLGLDVYSLDVSRAALEISERIAKSEKVLFDRPPIRFTRFDGRRIPLDDASVDRILCNDALHHVPNVEEVLGEMSRVLRPGGIAGFCEPGPRHSLQPRAQIEMKQFRVLENDVDLEAIHPMALEVGFTRMSVSVFSPYPVEVGFEEWRTLSPTSPAVKRFADQAFARMRSNTLFFLHK